jgi:hypothetical protein
MGDQYQEQEMQQPNQSPYFQPTIMPSDKADLMDKINPEAIVEIIKNQLMGYEYDKMQMRWVSTHKKGLTPLGAFEICSLMLSVSSKNVSISKLTDSEIRDRTKNIHKEAMRMCIRNWREYGISGADQIGLISQIVVSNTFITLKQPEGAGIRELLKGTTQEVRSIQESPKKEGMLSGIFRR